MNDVAPDSRATRLVLPHVDPAPGTLRGRVKPSTLPPSNSSMARIRLGFGLGIRIKRNFEDGRPVQAVFRERW
jgi:hypothetical protein